MVVRGIIAPIPLASHSLVHSDRCFFFFSPRQAENVLGHCAAVPRDFPALLEPSIARSLTPCFGRHPVARLQIAAPGAAQEALCTSRV
jgi:hypothetical protein